MYHLIHLYTKPQFWEKLDSPLLRFNRNLTLMLGKTGGHYSPRNIPLSKMLIGNMSDLNFGKKYLS